MSKMLWDPDREGRGAVIQGSGILEFLKLTVEFRRVKMEAGVLTAFPFHMAVEGMAQFCHRRQSHAGEQNGYRQRKSLICDPSFQ